MKNITITAALSALFASGIHAQCTCESWDNVCNNQCVAEANACIIGCGDDNGCYTQCIADHWPGVEHPSKTMSSTPCDEQSSTAHHVSSTAHHVSSTTMSSSVPTTTHSMSSPSSSWTSSWTKPTSWTPTTSSTMWYPSHTTPGVPSTPTHSGSSSLKAVTEITFGLAFVAIVYFLQ